MITIDQYVGTHRDNPDWTMERHGNACLLLTAVNALEDSAKLEGLTWPVNSNTKSQISGLTFGGFRPQNCPQGSAHSSHKEGLGVDVYDPDNKIDEWLNDRTLEEHGLYREHPDSTSHWCHLTIRAPSSGKRTFLP